MLTACGDAPPTRDDLPRLPFLDQIVHERCGSTRRRRSAAGTCGAGSPSPATTSRWPGPGEFLPFGGGAHRCPGAALAVAELTVLLARLVVRAELEPVPAPVRPSGFLAMRPVHGVPVRVRSVRHR
ncbi:cytochrome P450 [Pseudonocardia sp. NPDC046786]|uniref:cytochrome P450 n=1 Tax=Pseudonocardia sp. NPDC046786 TaxID=3155471 RepID=UPI0033DFF4CE